MQLSDEDRHIQSGPRKILNTKCAGEDRDALKRLGYPPTIQVTLPSRQPAETLQKPDQAPGVLVAVSK